MCVSPNSIRNPNYGLKYSPALSRVIDTWSEYLAIPCHHCSECIHNDQLSLVQRLQMESLCNYLYFATLTYNNDMIPSITTSTGYDIKYADWRDLQLCFKRLYNRNAFIRPFRYLAVSERGKKRGRPHFHVVFLIPRYESDDEYTPLQLESVIYTRLKDEWRRKVGGSSRKPVYKPLFTYQIKIVGRKVFRNYDCHYVVPSVNDHVGDVAFYVTKYLLKRVDKETRLQQALHLNLPQDEYDSTWKLVKSRIDSSLHLGLSPVDGRVAPKIQEYISSCVARSEDFPKFFDYCGNSYPLSHYYKSIPYLFSLDDALRLNKKPDNTEKSYSQLMKSVRDYERQINTVADRGDFDNYSYLFD